ncbi:CoA-disulfide reductase [Staphylococcus canis]|uniref:CoA-disulfide reductase n=1 Tax=Staphylococcus canis TaxID=2724942 RepID=A0ABS0T973_9STAP|nr:CoA-disulfide reductase [Staphylococcus canis]MBI5975295.1 CoA-disulfide reductase [Staphylococcus canis]
MTRKIIIVGAVAGGATSASQIRRLDTSSEITVYEKDAFMSFANCGLPYYLGNVIEKREKLLPETPDTFKSNRNIDVKLKHEVIAINSQKQTITVKDHTSGETFEDTYDVLILSPGARARRLDIEAPNLFTLRNMEDTDRIENFIRTHSVENVLIVGAGYVSLEMVENMYKRGLKPTLIHHSESINKHIEQDLNQVIFEELDAREIPYRLNESIASIDGKTVTFTSGQVESYDLIITGIGIVPNSEFVEGSGIQLDEYGYIPVNHTFQTNVPNIYAIGDISTGRYRHVDLPAHIPLAWGAHRAASVVAEHLVNPDHASFKGFLGASIVQFFDYTLASTGITQDLLPKFDYAVVDVNNKAHAGYYPNNARIQLRVYFDKSTRRILRAAAVGKKGVDKRIDVLSMAMMNDTTVDDLVNFEVAYAPPFSHPKDLINMVGYKARNK